MLDVPIVTLAPMPVVMDGVVIGRGARGRHKATHCKRGHALIPSNLYLGPNGARRCQTCRVIVQANYDR